jgi:hypothetical protein
MNFIILFSLLILFYHNTIDKEERQQELQCIEPEVTLIVLHRSIEKDGSSRGQKRGIPTQRWRQ